MKIVLIALLLLVTSSSRVLCQVDPFAADAIQRMRAHHVTSFNVKSYPFPDSVAPTYIENSVIVNTRTGFQIKTTTISEGRPLDTTIRDYTAKGQLRALAKRSASQHSLSRWRYNEFDSVSELIESMQLTSDTSGGTESNQLNTFAKVGKVATVRRVQTEFFDNGNEKSTDRYVYDTLGRLDSIQRDLHGFRTSLLILFMYNASGLLTQKAELRYLPDDNVDTNLEKYTYDANGRKNATLYYVSVPSSPPQRPLELTKDSAGHLPAPGTFKPGGHKVRDASNPPKRPQMILQLIAKDMFDTIGHLVEHDMLSREGRSVNKQKFTYKNDRLARSEQVSIMADGSEGGTDQTTYTYDALGDLIKSEDSHNGQIAFTRTISYTFSKQ
jgi:hypothetical protein